MNEQINKLLEELRLELDELEGEWGIKLQKKICDLKYGPNPQQKGSAWIDSGQELPVETLNGTPGYINWLDALDAAQDVLELDSALDKPCATVFKHDSPAGVGTSNELFDRELLAFGVSEGKKLTHLSTAFIRAFQNDPKSAMGGFVALSRKVDHETAMEMKALVLDGAIAPDYDEEALEILKKKKDGKFPVLRPTVGLEELQAQKEERKRCGITFKYESNKVVPTPDMIKDGIVTENKNIMRQTIEDLCVAGVSAKYSQSNSVSMAFDGQTTGVGAGGQSRVDVVDLAGQKTNIFYLRFMPELNKLQFKEGVKRQNRLHTQLAYITGALFKKRGQNFLENLVETPIPISAERKEKFLQEYRDHIALWSDAFFPFRDGIDAAAEYGVKYIAHTGIGVRNEDVIKAANEYGIVLIEVGKDARFFKH